MQSDITLRTVDVVVLGCGASGMAAALAAHEAGAHVVVVEPQTPDTHTPSVRMSGGWIMTTTEQDGAARYLELCGGGLLDAEVCKTWAKAAMHLEGWLNAMGVELDGKQGRPAEQSHVEGAQAIRVGRAYTKIGAKFPGRGGNTLRNEGAISGEAVYRGLMQAVQNANIEILWGHEPLQLSVDRTQDAPSITGVVVRAVGSEEERVLNARKGVVIATGGFGADPYLVEQFLGLPARFYGNPGNAGGGLRLAMSVGADLVRMNRMVGRGVPSFKTGPDQEIAFMVDMTEGGYVIVDQGGKRYANEHEQAELSHAFHYHMMHFDRERVAYSRSPSYYIFDENRRKAGPLTYQEIGPCAVGLYSWSADNSREIEAGWIGKGATPAEAAIAVGCPKESAESLNETVNRYNEICRPNSPLTDPFGRPRDSLKPLNNGPYYAVPLYIGGPYPHGGPSRNANGQVIAQSREVIPGLYSVGEMGQAIGVLYPAPGASISEALCLGRVAGTHIATAD